MAGGAATAPGGCGEAATHRTRPEGVQGAQSALRDLQATGEFRAYHRRCDAELDGGGQGGAVQIALRMKCATMILDNAVILSLICCE